MDLAEVIRLLENIVRTGTVTEIDEEKWRVRVKAESWIPPGCAGMHSVQALSASGCRRLLASRYGSCALGVTLPLRSSGKSLQQRQSGARYIGKRNDRDRAGWSEVSL
jgi:hypothetical protein